MIYYTKRIAYSIGNENSEKKHYIKIFTYIDFLAVSLDITYLNKKQNKHSQFVLFSHS